MDQERDLARTHIAPSAPAHDDDLAPGRGSRSSQMNAPAHPIVGGLIQRKARDANGVADGADDAVAAAASSAGSSLPEPIMRKFESSLGTDLSSVRIHTGNESANAASAVGAKAYTLGNHIHFGPGYYDPSSNSGQHLLAHEVAHTVQNQGGAVSARYKLEVSTPGDSIEIEADHAADAMVNGRTAVVSAGAHVQRVARETTGEIVEWSPIQDDVAWNDKYDEQYAKTRPKSESAQQDFDNERNSGKVKSAISAGGTKVKTQISSDQLKRIISAGGEKAAAERIAPMAGGISQAFETMLIDTAQAQADYLAHMAGETGGVLLERDGDKRSYAPFQGRGAVQVTHPENYAKALGILQQRADQLQEAIDDKGTQIAALMTQRDQAASQDDKKQATDKIAALHAEVEPLRQQLFQLQEAINAIKAEPSKAADEKYAFLLSAAHMQRTGAVCTSSKLGSTASFTGKGAEDSWVTGGNNGMTFDERKTQNEGELVGLKEKLSTETDQTEIDKLQKQVASRDKLIKDMESAKSRGAKKQAVYGAGVRILSQENAVVSP